jgi:hypothetical protein
MADAARRDGIVSAIVTRLKGILVSSGYQTDAGKNVFLWRMTPLGGNEVPGCIVRDPDRRVTYEYSDTVRDYELTVEVVGIGSPGNPDDLGAVGDDIYKALLEADRTFEGLINDITPESDEKVYDQQAQRIGALLIRFKVRYRTS